MKYLSLALFLSVFLLLFHYYGSCFACFEEERIALLELNSTRIEGRYSLPLPTWVDDEKSDCCAWERIKCDNTTARVIQLSLSRMFPNPENDVLLLNASMFLPFKELQHLDLSYNYMNGWMKNEGLDRLSQLKKLEVLNLHGNAFNSSILPSLSALTSLKTLDLGFNRLVEGPLSDLSKGFSHLSNLTRLDVLKLNGNYLPSAIIPSLAALTSIKTLDLSDKGLNSSSSEFSSVFKNLSNLQVLDLSYNKGLFLPFHDLANMSNLKALSLSYNGIIYDDISGFCELNMLQELDLNGNKLNGTLPPCLSNLTSLKMLDLSNNGLSGNIPPYLMSNLTSLVMFDLSGNQLSGSIPPSNNLTSLEYISFSNNQLDGTAWFTTSLADGNFRLKVLSLSNCNLNISTTELLKILHNQRNITFLDLSHNKITGNYPNWLVQNNTKLEILILRDNSLNGRIHFPVNSLNGRKLWLIDVSKNDIQGQLQTNLGDVLPALRYLNLSSNGLQGTIPASLNSLYFLDLSSNNFSGEIPTLFGEYLYTLILSNNNLHGEISTTLFTNTSQLTILRLSNNSFTGFQVQNNNVDAIYLRTLDISQNHISGRIPTWIGNLTNLDILNLRNNSFDGHIPLELCNLNIEYLDLSQNHLSGVIPSCPNLTSLKYIHLQGNKLTGELPRDTLIKSSSSLLTIDLNNNNLHGNIPSWFGLIQNLRVLLLKGNLLSGPIPHELCQLNNIGILDLSNNSFSGSIPPCFSNITFGKGAAAVERREIRDNGGTLGTSNYDYIGLLGNKYGYSFQTELHVDQEEVEFMTKSRTDIYRGGILNFMAGIDLSCNNFTGDIPLQLGNLTAIRALNFSHNHLTGSIPKNLSNLEQLESMDLSHNKLSGHIPSELTGIHTLSVFTVAFNNLTGRTPEMKAQFSTFNESSYEGNPFLCGPPLQKQCNNSSSIPDSGPDDTSSEEYGGIDLNSLLASSAGSFVVSLVAFVVVLYLNPYWRRLWFDFIDSCLSFMFPFWSDVIYNTTNPWT